MHYQLLFVAWLCERFVTNKEKQVSYWPQPDSPQSVNMPPAEQFFGNVRWHHKNERLIINSVKWVVQLLWTEQHSASRLTFATQLFHKAKFIFKDWVLNGTVGPIPLDLFQKNIETQSFPGRVKNLIRELSKCSTLSKQLIRSDTQNRS